MKVRNREMSFGCIQFEVPAQCQVEVMRTELMAVSGVKERDVGWR